MSCTGRLWQATFRSIYTAAPWLLWKMKLFQIVLLFDTAVDNLVYFFCTMRISTIASVICLAIVVINKCLWSVSLSWLYQVKKCHRSSILYVSCRILRWNFLFFIFLHVIIDFAVLIFAVFAQTPRKFNSRTTNLVFRTLEVKCRGRMHDFCALLW